MKRKIAALVVFIAIAVMSISGTMAYFTADSVATNVITAGNIDITLEEWEVEDQVPYNNKNKQNIMPGSEIDKIVKVRNHGSNPAYIRVAVEKVIALADGMEGTADLSLLHCPINTEYWIEKDGYYYYQHILEAGEATEPLFEKVIFDKAMGNMYQNCEVTINVKAEAVQSENNEKEDVTTVTGWPTTPAAQPEQ